MQPISPVLPSNPKLPETLIAKDQKPYLPLPIYRNGEFALSRWNLSWSERIKVLLTGNIWLWIITPMEKPFPPIKLQVEEPK